MGKLSKTKKRQGQQKNGIFIRELKSLTIEGCSEQIYLQSKPRMRAKGEKPMKKINQNHMIEERFTKVLL